MARHTHAREEVVIGYRGRRLPDPPPAGVLVLIYTVAGLASIGCMLAAPVEPFLAAAAFCVTMAAYWVAFFRADRRWVGVELTVIAATGVALGAPLAAFWMTAAGLAGGLGAFLSFVRAAEDDFYYLPLLGALASFGLLFVVGFAVGIAPSPQGIRDQYVKQKDLMYRNFVADVRTTEAQGRTLPGLTVDKAERMAPTFGQAMLTVWISFWAMGIWAMGRVARRILTHVHAPRPAFNRFQMRQRYIFLLIAGLVLEILSILYGHPEMSYLSWPLMALCILACFFEGLAVILYATSIQRASGILRSAHWQVLFVALAVIFWQVTAFVGLFDVWIDFRKIGSMHPRHRTQA
ncbi:MAG: DUF2232 domain-containing protein [bacterium]|nr:DUF2232 domain-containing protein [bacterium]